MPEKLKNLYEEKVLIFSNNEAYIDYALGLSDEDFHYHCQRIINEEIDKGHMESAIILLSAYALLFL